MLHLEAEVRLWGAAVAHKFRAKAYGAKGGTENQVTQNGRKVEKKHKPGDGMWLPTQEMTHMHEPLF
jgi:hypothetical protein